MGDIFILIGETLVHSWRVGLIVAIFGLSGYFIGGEIPGLLAALLGMLIGGVWEIVRFIRKRKKKS
jgi:hypothetical protein